MSNLRVAIVHDALANDGALRQVLIARGRKRAAEFSWATAARQTVDLYERLFQ